MNNMFSITFFLFMHFPYTFQAKTILSKYKEVVVPYGGPWKVFFREILSPAQSSMAIKHKIIKQMIYCFI